MSAYLLGMVPGVVLGVIALCRYWYGRGLVDGYNRGVQIMRPGNPAAALPPEEDRRAAPPPDMTDDLTIYLTDEQIKALVFDRQLDIPVPAEWIGRTIDPASIRVDYAGHPRIVVTSVGAAHEEERK